MLQLMKHQEEALDFLQNRKAAGLFLTMGLGKSVVTLEHLNRLIISGEQVFPCLIVAPLSGVGVWEGEVEKFGYLFRTARLTGTYKQRVNTLATPADIYLINYEGLRILERHLFEKKFKCIVLDESHRVCNRGTQQTKVATLLSQTIPYRYILTGTPICKSPEDVWSQFQLIAPGYLGNFYAFQARHVDFKKINIKVKGGGHREIRKPVRFKYLDELNQKLQVHSIRRTKEECLDLPEKIFKKIPCPLTAEQQKHYHGLKHCLATMVGDQQLKLNSMVEVMQKLQQITQGFMYLDKGVLEMPSGKQQIFFDLMEDLVNEKVVVFTWFTYDTQMLCKKLAEKGYKVLQYDGGFDERKRIVDEFQTCKEPCVFVSNVERAKESITLTAANQVIYYGNSWNYATRVQSLDRCHRIGQKRSVNYYDLVVPQTIDELIYDSLQYKGDVAGKITGDAKRMAEMILAQGEDV